MARCHLNTNQEFEDQFAVSLLLSSYIELRTNILLQSINGCDEDLSETIGTSQHLKKLNRFRNITVCKHSGQSTVSYVINLQMTTIGSY